MRKLLIAIALTVASVAHAVYPVLTDGGVLIQTREVLVLASAAVEMPRLSNRRGIEIQNLGPNAIYCAIGDSAVAVSTKSRKIAAGDFWSLNVPAAIRIWCIAATADQVTGAATITNELR